MARILGIPFIAALSMTSGLPSAALSHTAHGSKQPPRDSAAVTGSVRTGGDGWLFQSVANWCRIPEGRETLGATHGAVVVDREGLIYCSMDSGQHGILVYRPDGTLAHGIADGLTGIHGMCIRTEGDDQVIYAAHLRDRQVLKLKLDGTVIWSIEGPPMESGKYDDPKSYKPTAVAVGPNGDVYVADGYGANWIHRYGKERNYLGSFGGRGREPGKFQTCHGLALDTRGEEPLLLVCDRENRRLVHFDLDGKFVAVIAESLRRPCSVAFYGDTIAVAELEGRVTLLDGSNEVIAHLGDNPDRRQWANYRVPVSDWKNAVFTAPHGVAWDEHGNLFVMDWNASGRISRLDRVKEQL